MTIPTLLIFVLLHFLLAMVPLAFNLHGGDDCNRDKNEFACKNSPLSNELITPELPGMDDDTSSNVFSKAWKKVSGAVADFFGAVIAIWNVLSIFFTFNYDWLAGEDAPNIQKYGVWVLRSVLSISQIVLLGRLALAVREEAYKASIRWPV